MKTTITTKEEYISRLASFLNFIVPVHESAFNPFNRLDDAMIIVEKIRETGISFILESHGAIGSPGRWWSYFPITILDRSVNGYGPNAPTAISLAAISYLDYLQRKEKENGN